MSDHDPSAGQGPETQEAPLRFPLSTMQRQLWFIDQMNPGDPTLNVAVRWELRGPVRNESIEDAFKAIIARHEILRTRFVEEDGAPLQEVLDAAPFRLGLIDLRTTPAARHAERLDEIAQEDAARPFDLTQPGLLRATLVRLAPERAVLLIVAHHVVFDGYSIGVLGQELGTIAAALEAGQAPELPELPLQYGDYALWQEEYLASGVLAEDSAYWAAQMKDAPYFELPADKPRPALRSTAVTRRSRALPAEFMPRFEAAAKARGVSTFTLGAAALAATLHRVTGKPEVLFSTPVAGRAETDLEPLIGPFISHQVLRLPTADETPFSAHLATTRRVVEEALTHQSLPFSKLVEIVNPPRDPSRAPLVSVAFSLQHVFLRDARYGGFELVSAPSHTPGAAQDLNVVIIGRPAQGWHLHVEYCPELFEPETIEALMATLLADIEAVLADPELPLGALPADARLGASTEAAAPGLTQVEAVLAGHPEVAAAAAVAVEGGSYAFVSPQPDSLVPLEGLPVELMGYAARRLPAAEMPQGISVLAALPRGARGEIDRARLPAPPHGTSATAMTALLASSAPQPAPFVAAEGAAVAPAAPAAVKAGAGEIEDRLAALWAELLDQPEPPRETSFFDLGGHSLLAVRLMSRIRETWGVRFGVATIYAHPTIRALAARIGAEIGGTEEAQGDDWRIEPLETEGDAQPIIAVNDVAIMLSALGEMRDRHPAACVRLFDGTRGIDQRPRSFEEIAAEYAKVIRKHQPHGPYLLFGVCVHGNIALEAARILQAEGEKVAVVIKDVWEPGYAASLKADKASRWRERRFALANRIRMVRAGTMSLPAMLGSYRLIRKTGLLQLAVKVGLIERGALYDLAPELQGFVTYISAARDVYRPAPFDAPVLHVVTKITPHGKHFLPSVGWEKVVTGPLKTVNIDEVLVKGERRLGTAELAREIETFLAEHAAQ
ncbi:condensation domain-containing protein [Acidimangrovimonas pyrenivorans]|uniref:Condensation domain-containing protein n=1 Tax=Acidimangrovimonas pyrenivorans TaxID=2030798 RepID=A0ABV7ABN1_9RHOB